MQRISIYKSFQIRHTRRFPLHWSWHSIKCHQLNSIFEAKFLENFRPKATKKIRMFLKSTSWPKNCQKRPKLATLAISSSSEIVIHIGLDCRYKLLGHSNVKFFISFFNRPLHSFLFTVMKIEKDNPKKWK